MKKKNLNKIFIYGNYGCNTGDNAMLYALLEQFNTNIENSFNFSILTKEKLDFLPKTHKIRFIEYNKKKILLEIKKSDLFIVGGGTHFHDQGPNFERIVILVMILTLLIWAKIFCRKIYFLGTGIELPNTILGKFLIIQIHKMADKIVLRDTLSYKFLLNVGLGKKISSSFDLALLLDRYASKNIIKKKKTIGLSVIPFLETIDRNKKKDLIIVEKIARDLNIFLNKNEEYDIKLFIFSMKEEYGDIEITNSLKNYIKSPNVQIIPFNQNPFEILKEMSTCKFFIGMRYHSCLFAYLENIPLLIIESFGKTQSLADDIKLSKSCLISIDDILKGNLKNYLQKIHENPEQFKAKVPVKSIQKVVKSSLDFI